MITVRWRTTGVRKRRNILLPQLFSLLGVLGAYSLLAFFTAVTPFCAVYILWTAFSPLEASVSSISYLLHWSFIAYSALELTFQVYYFHLAQRAQSRFPAENHTVEFIKDAFTSCMSSSLAPGEVLSPTETLEYHDPRAVDFRAMLSYWFKGYKYEKIGKKNVIEWLSWSLFGQTFKEIIGEAGSALEVNANLSATEKLQLVDHCLSLLERRGGYVFPPGLNEEVHPITLTIDPIKIFHRPLFIYGLVTLLQFLSLRKLQRQGFTRHSEGNTQYLVRIPKFWASTATATKPILFLHGLGTGVASYSNFLSYLSTSQKLADSPIMILLQPQVSMSFFDKLYCTPMTERSCVKDLRAAFKRWSFDKTGMTILSHSNGTIVHSWILKRLPEMVHRSGFIDPICFCLWEPWVCYNFLHRPVQTPKEILLRYFVSRELGVTLVLQRAFSWSSAVLFPSQIPGWGDELKAKVWLAENDEIINANRVASYLTQAGGEISVASAKGHGGVLTQREGLEKWLESQ